MKTNKLISGKYIIRLAVLLCLAIGLYGILPQIGSFKGSFDHLRSSNVPYFAVLAMLATYFFAAVTYMFLALKPLKLGKTLLMQLSAMFANRLLPSGIGALGMNAAYLYKQKHTALQAGAVVGFNNLLGAIGHGFILICVLGFWREDLKIQNNFINEWGRMALLVMALLLVASVVFLKFKGNKLIKSAKEQIQQLVKYYKKRPHRLGAALITEICVSLSYTACLWQSMHAVGLAISLPAAFILLTLATAAGTALPTPGGIGGTEAGIYAGLIAMGQDAKTSLAGVILFRLISYWLPLVLGAVALIFATKYKLYSFTSVRGQSG